MNAPGRDATASEGRRDELDAVTGAYGYSGSHIARRLLAQGRRVITLTNSPQRRHPFRDAVPAFRFHFDEPQRLREALRGVRVLYNTYWVRFEHGAFDFEQAVRHTRTLFRAARAAKVERIVHVSITHASPDSDLPYFRGKGEVEEVLRDTGVAHTILRPAVMFGGDDILINNVAWALRRLPVFGVFGDGSYRLQPIHVDDFAALAVDRGLAPRPERPPETIAAIGPETYTFRGLVETIARAIGVRRPIVGVAPALGCFAARALGWLKHDVLVTGEEVEGLVRELLFVDATPVGSTRLSEWARRHAGELGRRYASELARRRDRERAYSEL